MFYHFPAQVGGMLADVFLLDEKLVFRPYVPWWKQTLVKDAYTGEL